MLPIVPCDILRFTSPGICLSGRLQAPHDPVSARNGLLSSKRPPETAERPSVTRCGCDRRYRRADQRPARASHSNGTRMTGTAARSPQRGIGDGTGASGTCTIMLHAVPDGLCGAVQRRQRPSERAASATSELIFAFVDDTIVKANANGESQLTYVMSVKEQMIQKPISAFWEGMSKCED